MTMLSTQPHVRDQLGKRAGIIYKAVTRALSSRNENLERAIKLTTNMQWTINQGLRFLMDYLVCSTEAEMNLSRQRRWFLLNNSKLCLKR